MALDPMDQAIVRATQAGLPLCREPYTAVAAQLNLTPAEVMQRIGTMLATRVIRQIGAVPNHYALGWRANGMSVWDVDDAALAELGPKVGAMPAVSHCYRGPSRWPDLSYNLFAMVHGRTRAEVETEIATIAQLLGSACRGHEVLYSTAILRKTGLRLGK
jgi:DNA-binding Lrp family transcriptional regulator